MVARAARMLEAVIGLFFVVTAAMKAVDVEAFAVQVSTYGVVKDPDLLVPIAYGTIGLEAILGIMLLAGFRPRWFVYTLALLLTVVFSALIVYAWRVKGIEDCGCFGKFVSMTPEQSLLKNAVLLGLLLVAWAGTKNVRHHHDGYRSHWRLRLGAAAASLVAVAGILAADYYDLIPGSESPAAATPAVVTPPDNSRPFARYVVVQDDQRHNLGEGDYLVAFLSATCEHCRASVPALNEYVWQENLPSLVALMQADSKEALDEFRLVTEPLFPTQPIKDLEFYSFIDKPPALFRVLDGVKTHGWSWDTTPPSASALESEIRSDAQPSSSKPGNTGIVAHLATR